MLVLADEKLGPQDPITTTPDRAPGSVRRTTTIDVSWPEGFSNPSQIVARGRDLLTPEHGEPSALASVEIQLIAASFGAIAEVVSKGDGADVSALSGVSLGPGFRRRVAEALASIEVPLADPTHLLLDDLAGATLVSGYGMMRAGVLAEGAASSFDGRADLCAGWAADGVMFDAIREHDRIPAPIGPPSPTIERADDPLGWHELDPLPPGAVRRRRRLDVAPDGSAEAMFRDSHVDDDGLETNLHEYALRAEVDPSTREIRSIDVTAHVLPWVECPGALASAQRLVGHPVDELRSHVAATFRGTSTCTHLNDMLRSLSDVAPLLSHLGS